MVRRLHGAPFGAALCSPLRYDRERDWLVLGGRMADSAAVKLRFEGIIGYATADAPEAAHFFEHTLGLPLAGDDGGMRFYELPGGLTLAVDVSGASAGDPPYLMFSTADLVRAGDHFLQRGFAIRELPWAPDAGGFIARSPDGHCVCVVDEASLGETEGG
jgi:catechol 2,3-dioxygenase-like lactoylglutathione lyase family enzyme